MGTPAPDLHRRWTVDDLESLPEDGQRYEIVDGELRVSPAPPWRHNTVAYRLALVLEPHRPADLEVVVPGAGVLTPRAYLIPDLAVVERALASSAGHAGDPAQIRLVVEVQSRSSAVDDVVEKTQLYAEASIRSYWRIEVAPELRIVVCELRDGALVEVAAGRQVTVERPFPVRLDVADLLPG